MDQNQDKNAEDRINEALSALMDGAVDELELRRLLRELPEQPELLATWKRYHAVRASLNQEVHANPRVDLLAGVQARLALEAEAAPQGSIGGIWQSRVVRYLGQGVIAASVAVAALMGVSLLQAPPSGETSVATIASATTTPAFNGEFNASEQARTVSFDVEAYNRLQQAVYREFSERPRTISVRYDPELTLELVPATESE